MTNKNQNSLFWKNFWGLVVGGILLSFISLVAIPIGATASILFGLAASYMASNQLGGIREQDEFNTKLFKVGGPVASFLAIVFSMNYLIYGQFYRYNKDTNLEIRVLEDNTDQVYDHVYVKTDRNFLLTDIVKSIDIFQEISTDEWNYVGNLSLQDDLGRNNFFSIYDINVVDGLSSLQTTRGYFDPVLIKIKNLCIDQKGLCSNPIDSFPVKIMPLRNNQSMDEDNKSTILNAYVCEDHQYLRSKNIVISPEEIQENASIVKATILKITREIDCPDSSTEIPTLKLKLEDIEKICNECINEQGIFSVPNRSFYIQIYS